MHLQAYANSVELQVAYSENAVSHNPAAAAALSSLDQ